MSPPELPDGSPDSPFRNARALPPPKRDVIAASDEDGDADSDDSSDGGFMDLMASFDSAKPAAVNEAYGLETPRAKRTMSAAHLSPLTINTRPQVMFDMKALARDAKIDSATKASSIQLRELVAESKREEPMRDTGLGTAIKDIVHDQGGQNAHKVMRAVHRAGDQAAPHFHFFKPGAKQSSPVTVPARMKNGPWKLLVHANLQTREQYVASGMPYTILRKKKELPSEVFEWVLNDLSTQTSRLLAQEYCSIINCCSRQVGSLVTSHQLEQMFVRLGAADEAAASENQHTVTRQAEDQYKGRDWCSLIYFLKLLAGIAQHMSVDAICYVTSTLLRVSMDRFLICSMDLLMDYEAAMRNLLRSLPDTRWDSFVSCTSSTKIIHLLTLSQCLECCKALHRDFKTQSIRLNALLALPVDSRRAHDLRRRLATAFLFEDSNLGGQDTSAHMTIRQLVDRLDQDDFAINAKTDFDELRASIIILDMVIDDGSFVPSDNADDETRFNADVDELASKLRAFWTKINDTGLKLARAQTKSVVEWVQQRVSVSVRTRRKVKRDIYDTALGNDPFLPRQKAMMKEFLGKKVRD